MNILLYGLDDDSVSIISGFLHNQGKGYRVVGVMDDNPKVWGTEIVHHKVLSPTELKNITYDYIVLCYGYETEPATSMLVMSKLINGYGVEASKVRPKEWLLLWVMEKIYGNTDAEIRRIMDGWYKGNPIKVFNFDDKEGKVAHKVYWDTVHDMPYIVFETVDGQRRRMYYPREHKFQLLNGEQIVRDVIYDQSPNSPHLYTYGTHKINEGDVIVDAGVCEGNFALKYINVAKKIYLFECDPGWCEALTYTFSLPGDREKVQLIDKAVSDCTGASSAKIDDIVNEPIDFLKMDIEGAEVAGLLGAEQTLKKSKAKCSICSYHRHDDEKYIRKLLDEYGYSTDVSKGYMFFMWDPDIWYHADFRHGIVYGDK